MRESLGLLGVGHDLKPEMGRQKRKEILRRSEDSNEKKSAKDVTLYNVQITVAVEPGEN